MTASYVLDHVMDEEVEAGSTIGLETAHGTTLVFMAEAALHDLATQLLPPAACSVLSAEVHRLLLTACAGQLQELLLVRGGVPTEFTTDDALGLTMRKAGSLGRLAGVIGSSLAEAEEATAELIVDCYEAFTTYRQVVDDLSDAPDTPGSTRKSDASRGKPTVPLLYMRNFTMSVSEQANDATTPLPIMGSTLSVSEESLRESGAHLFTQTVAEMLRNRTLGLLQQIEHRTGKIEGLSALLGAPKT